MDWNVTCNVPNEAGKFAGDSDADFVGFHLPTQAELAVSLGEAQLRLPCNIPDQLGLALLADLLLAPDVSGIAIRPGRFDQDTTGVLVPIRVIAPCRRVLPLECSEGTNPK
jgi:hypothetical protein